MGPLRITDFLKRYSILLRAPEGVVIESFRRILLERCSITVTKEEIKYVPHTKTLHIRAVGPKRSEILFHKAEILTQLESVLSKRDAPKYIV